MAWAGALTNADIVKMHDAEIAEATILLAIETNSPDYDTQVDALIALKEAGLAEQIIQAMLARQFAPEGSADPEGFLRKGMTWEQVLMVRGYPPAHRRPSIRQQRWTYGDSRLGQKSTFFNEQERLADGQNIY